MDVLHRNNVHISGSGSRTVVLAHGFGCDQTLWRYVIPQFSPSFRTVVFDYVGSGASDVSAYDPIRYATLHGYAQDLCEVLEATNSGPAIIVGHSVSSMIGALASIARPDLVAALVMLAPNPCFIDDGSYRGGFTRGDIEDLLRFIENNYAGWSQAMASVILGRPDAPQLEQEFSSSFCQSDPEIGKQFARATFLADHREDMPRIPRPVLILQCSEDAIAPRQIGDFLHATIPDSDLVIMEARGHCPNLSAPDETSREIFSFLKRRKLLG